MTLASLFLFAIGVGSLTYATIEDLKYRQITPLPLMIGSIIGIIINGVTSSLPCLWYYAFFAILLIFSAKAFSSAYPKFLPEGDVILLASTVLMSNGVFHLLAVLMMLWIPEVLLRLVFKATGRIERLWNDPIPFAPVSLIAYILGFVVYEAVGGVVCGG